MAASFHLQRTQWVLVLALLAAGCGGKGKQGDAEGAEGAAGQSAGQSAGEASNKVPAGAQLVSEQKGNTAYYASFPGAVYVVDGKTNQVIYVGPIDRGQKVIVFAQARQLIVNGVVVPDVQIDPARSYKIYFARG